MSVAEVADLLQRLAGSWQRVHVQGCQVDGGGRELLVGALVVRAQAVDPPVEVLQVNLLVVLFGEGGVGKVGIVEQGRGQGGLGVRGGNKEREKERQKRRRGEGCYRSRRE